MPLLVSWQSGTWVLPSKKIPVSSGSVIKYFGSNYTHRCKPKGLMCIELKLRQMRLMRGEFSPAPSPHTTHSRAPLIGPPFPPSLLLRSSPRRARSTPPSHPRRLAPIPIPIRRHFRHARRPRQSRAQPPTPRASSRCSRPRRRCTASARCGGG